MAITFAVRGDSKNARYSLDGKTPGTIGTVTTEADATAIGGNRLNLYQGSIAKHQLKYVGRYNLPTVNTMSILIRYATSFTGSPGSNMGIFEMGTGGAINTGASGQYAYFGCNHLTTGAINLYHYGEDGTSGVAPATVKSGWSPTSGQWFDLVWTYTGGTTNAIKFYIDGSLQTTTTTGASWPSTKVQELYPELTFGAGGTVSNSGFYINEIVIWDSVIDPTSVTLTSGTGSLNGSSRTAFVDVASLDGRSNSAPAASDVRSGTAYTVAGTAYTGTCAVPTAANVKSGVSVDATTGTCAVPAASNVRLGTSVNATTGTLVVPQAATVQEGVVFDNGTTGTLSVSTIATKVDELWKIAGLDSSNPMTVTPTSREAGTIVQTITGDGTSSTTVTRE